MRILIRTSRLSTWSRAFGVFGLVVLVLAGILHLLGILESEPFEIILILTSLLGALAVVLAILAYLRLWHTGDLGWGRAILGFLTGIAALAPLGAALVLVVSYPSTDDVTTDSANPVPLALRPESGSPQTLDTPAFARAFPTLTARSYEIAPEQLFALIEALVALRDWEIVRRSGPATQEGVGVLNVIETTLLGWQNELVFRVTPSGEGAALDLRLASVRPPYHDLGHNGRTATAFLADLDEVVGIFDRALTLMLEDADIVPVETGD